MKVEQEMTNKKSCEGLSQMEGKSSRNPETAGWPEGIVEYTELNA